MAESFGDWVKERIYEILEEVTMAVISPEDSTLVTFPRTVVYGDPQRGEVLDDLDTDEIVTLTEESESMALEAILLGLNALPQAGIHPDDPLFKMITDLSATFYVRGFIFGTFFGLDAPLEREALDSYITDVVDNVNQQAASFEDGEDKPDDGQEGN